VPTVDPYHIESSPEGEAYFRWPVARRYKLLSIIPFQSTHCVDSLIVMNSTCDGPRTGFMSRDLSNVFISDPVSHSV
jgi:hypothetical protein